MKQLTPLEALEKIKDEFLWTKKDLKNINTIEKSLKRLEKQNVILRIIKENCEFDFLKTSVNDSIEFEVHIRPKNKEQLLFTCIAIYPKTQSEFDLLKYYFK